MLSKGELPGAIRQERDHMHTPYDIVREAFTVPLGMPDGTRGGYIRTGIPTYYSPRGNELPLPTDVFLQGYRREASFPPQAFDLVRTTDLLLSDIAEGFVAGSDERLPTLAQRIEAGLPLLEEPIFRFGLRKAVHEVVSATHEHHANMMPALKGMFTIGGAAGIEVAVGIIERELALAITDPQTFQATIDAIRRDRELFIGIQPIYPADKGRIPKNPNKPTLRRGEVACGGRVFATTILEQARIAALSLAAKGMLVFGTEMTEEEGEAQIRIHAEHTFALAAQEERTQLFKKIGLFL